MKQFNKETEILAVFSGGISNEREVSLRSGKAIYDTFKANNYNALLIDVNTFKSFQLLESCVCEKVRLEKEFELEDIRYLLRDMKKIGIDYVFNALHGEFGEDGKFSAIMELLEIPYSGSGILASALGMDKLKCYQILEKFDIPVPKTYFYKKNSTDLFELLTKLPDFPLFIKPNSGGSSLGISVAKNLIDLEISIKNALLHDSTALIQEIALGTEVTCPVVGNSENHSFVFPVGLISSGNELFDYDAKYSSDKTQEIFPAPISGEQAEKIQKLAIKVHEILGCKGLSRSDFIVNEKTGEIKFLEINTSPGMSGASLSPKAAASINLNFIQLLEKIIQQS